MSDSCDLEPLNQIVDRAKKLRSDCSPELLGQAYMPVELISKRYLTARCIKQGVEKLQEAGVTAPFVVKLDKGVMLGLFCDIEFLTEYVKEHGNVGYDFNSPLKVGGLLFEIRGSCPDEKIS